MDTEFNSCETPLCNGSVEMSSGQESSFSYHNVMIWLLKGVTSRLSPQRAVLTGCTDRLTVFNVKRKESMWEPAATAKSFQTAAAGDGRERCVLLPPVAAASPP